MQDAPSRSDRVWLKASRGSSSFGWLIGREMADALAATLREEGWTVAIVEEGSPGWGSPDRP